MLPAEAVHFSQLRVKSYRSVVKRSFRIYTDHFRNDCLWVA